MGLESAIQRALEKLERVSAKSDEDQMFEESMHLRKNDMDSIRTQIDDAKQEIAILNESIRNLEEDRMKKTTTIKAKKSLLKDTTSELEAVREETRKNAEKIKKFRERKVEASSVLSRKDIAALEETKGKLRVCCALTGVYFNSTEKSVSGGYVANTATDQIKLFNVSGLSRKEATEQLWSTIEKTTAILE